MNHSSLDVQESLIAILSLFPVFVTYKFENNFGKQNAKQKILKQ
jgi:hypothetical protein